MKIYSTELPNGDIEVTTTLQAIDNVIDPRVFLERVLEGVVQEYAARNKEKMDKLFPLDAYDNKRRLEDAVALRIAKTFVEKHFQEIAQKMDTQVIANLAVALSARELLQFSKGERNNY